MASYSNIPPIKIGELEVLLVQGGMGVGISQSKLAVAVAEQGGAGIIASVGLGLLKRYFDQEIIINRDRLRSANELEKRMIIEDLYIKANQDALREEIRKAKSATNGVVGVNIMHVLSDYKELVKTAVEENVELIISGAGVPKDLPNYLQGKNIKIAPIVGSGRLAEFMCKAWAKLYHLPDAIVVEGPMAGGHLAYTKEQLNNNEFVERGLVDIIGEVVQSVKKYEYMGNRKIPVIAAGGIFYGGDIRKYNGLGASGAQIATRFVTTNECDADYRFKKAYLDADKEDLVIIDSPVGMPGRAIENKFLKKISMNNKLPTGCPYHCLKSCEPEKSPYCIARALVNAQKGELEQGFVFAGANAWRCNEIVSVKDIFRALDREYSIDFRCELTQG